MPNSTWFTPYKFPPSKCLSLGPSQGIVYKVSDNTVVKLPFQYPVAKFPPTDETNEQLEMSVRSFALYKKEAFFYTIIAKNPHPNLAQRLQTNSLTGILLPRYESVEQIWGLQTTATHFAWVKQLVSAVVWLENLGYTHGDIKIGNMGIDVHNQLRLFDFGSVMHCDGDGFSEQIADDQFALATCIHFLASGIDYLAKANSYAEVKNTIGVLQRGQGIVDEAAKCFEEIIQAGWTGAVSLQSSLKRDMVNISNKAVDQHKNFLPEEHAEFNPSVFEEDSQWMNEEAYRVAWQAEGYETPDDIWG